MANRYANLVGSNKIKDEWSKINTGFDKVEQEMDEKPDASIAQVNDIEFDADDTLTLEGGTGITVTTVPGEKKVRFVATGESTPGPHAIEHITGGSDVIPNATTSASGLMSAADKLALDAHIAALVSDPGGVHGLQVETGTFTPVLAGIVTPGNNTYSVQTGRYVKVGRVVHFFVQLTLASKDPNMSGAIVISGLPFTVDGASAQSAATIAIYRFVDRTTDHQLGGRIEPPARISLWENGVNVGPKSLDPPQITDTSQFVVSGVYLTNQ